MSLYEFINLVELFNPDDFWEIKFALLDRLAQAEKDIEICKGNVNDLDFDKLLKKHNDLKLLLEKIETVLTKSLKAKREV